MKFLATFLMLCIALSANAQQIICGSTSTNFNTTLGSNRGVTWKIKRTLDNVFENGAVATISLPNGGAISFGSNTSNADIVNISFTKPGNYTIIAECFNKRNFFSSTQQTDRTFTVAALLAQPEIQFVGIDVSQCNNSSVNLRVKEPQVGVTYTWAPSGSTGTQISTSSSPVTVTATSPNCPNLSPKGSIGFIPPLPLGPGPANIFGVSNPCIQTLSDRFFSVGAPNINGCSTFQWTVSGSAAVVGPDNNQTVELQFFGAGASGTVSVVVTNFGNPTLTSSATFNFTTNTDPNCEFFFTDPNSGGGGQASSFLKTKNTTGTVALYPNPVSDVLRLDQLQDYNNLRVVDQYGKVLNTQVIGDGETQKSLNVAQFANGLYLIQFTNKTGEVTTKKFQVMH